MPGKAAADVGIFGGSGFYSLLEDGEQLTVDTPYGAPSAPVTVGKMGPRATAFMPRHGRRHEYPPHKINYRANIYAFKELGVTRIIAPCAAGSLSPKVAPGTFVLCDQFVDRTSGRLATFFDGPITTHISTADPYCPQMRDSAARVLEKLGIPHLMTGTVVVIEGPRFSTRSESRWFASQGWEVINMTQFPEVVLARERELCYLNVSLITDYDTGLVGHPDIQPVTHDEVIRVFNENNEKLKNFLRELVAQLPSERTCGCGKSLEGARF